MQRRQVLLVALSAAPALAPAQATFPSRPITLVVPAAPGGAVDILARALGTLLAERLGQPVVVDNRPGAGGTLAAQAVAQAAPDGHTLLLTHGGPILTAPFMFSNLRYDPLRDFAYLTQLCTGTLVLAANAARVPARRMQEFVSWTAQRPGQVSYGSYGIGTAGHLVSAYLDHSRKLRMTHVAYKGEAPMVNDLVGGQIDWGAASLAAVAPHLQSGRLRALAVLGDKRLPELPDVPTMGEAGLADPEFRPVGWAGVVAPARTPAAVLARLEQEVRSAAQSAAMKARYQTFGMYALATSAAEFRADVEASTPITERLVKLSGARAE